MKVIEVVAAIIYKDGAYFTTQRGYGEFEGMWEFPGVRLKKEKPQNLPLSAKYKRNLG